MKAIFISISLFSVFLLQGFFFRFGLGSIEPPLLLLVVFYWFFRMHLGERLLFAFLVALFFESISIFSPGSYVVVLLFLASCIGIVQSVFINTTPYVIEGIEAFFFLFLAALLVQVYSFVMGVIHGVEMEFTMYWVSFLLWSIVWVFLYLFLMYIMYRNAFFRQKTIPQSFS